MSEGWPAPIERIEVHLGDEGSRLPHARLRHLTRSTFSEHAQIQPDLDSPRMDLLLTSELIALPDTLRMGVTSMASNLRQARMEGADIPKITFRLLSKGGMLVEEMDA